MEKIDWVKANPGVNFKSTPALENQQASWQPVETEKAYFIEASTGCTCCGQENRIIGPFLLLENAIMEAEAMHASAYLASQYASQGLYRIAETPCRRLPDGSLLLDAKYITAGFKDENACGIDVHPDRIVFSLTFRKERFGKYDGRP